MSAPKPPKSLGRRAATAGGWNLIWVVGENALRLGSNLIMTRILLPEAFAMMMIAMTVLTALNLLTDIGIIRSITRDEDGASDHFLRVAWAVKVRRGAVISGLVLLCAVLVFVLAPHLAKEGTVYADPRLPGLLALTALAPLFLGLESTAKELANRTMEFRRFVGLMLGARVLSIGAMIGFAMLSPTVWALMLGALTLNLLQCAGSHLVLKGPKMRFVRDAEIEERLWSFGKFIMGSSAFNLLGNYTARFFLGAMMPAAAFGYFAVAMIWIDAGRMVIQRVGGFVGQATLAEVQRKTPARVPQVFQRLQLAIDGICILAFAACVTVGPYVLGLLYPERFAPVGDYIRILGLQFLAMRFAPFGALLTNAGNSRAIMVNSALRAVGAMVMVPAGFSMFGIKGALIGAALVPIAGAPYFVIKARRLITRGSFLLGWVWIVAVLTIALLFTQIMDVQAPV